MIFKQNMISIS